MKRCPCWPSWSAACGAVGAALGLPPPGGAAPPQPTEAEIRRQLDEVLARPEFAPPGGAQLWLLQRLADFFDWLGGLREVNPILFWVLLAGALLLLALLAAHIAWTVRRALFVGPRLAGSEPPGERRERLSLAYWEEARRRAARGEFTEAIRFLFLSLVYRFDESGRALFQEAYTNREYLGLFADRPQVQAELRVFVDTLDEHWYGQRPTDEQQYRDCLALYERLK